MTERQPARIKHFANIGDIIASLAAIKKYSEITKRKVIFCQQLNVPASYYTGATHPTVDDDGIMVMCNKKMFDMIRPLIIHQEYINDMEVYSGQPINIDLDIIRKERFVNIPHQALQQWIFLVYPDMAADLSKEWVSVGEVDISNCFLINPNLVTIGEVLGDLSDKVIVNFTERYRNHILEYHFLSEYQDKLIFAGTEREYLLFTKKWDLSIPRLIINDFLQLAYILKKVKFTLSNQSFIWNLCEAMKVPRLLELCDGAPNCQAFIGEKSYGYYIQNAVKYYFKQLLK